MAEHPKYDLESIKKGMILLLGPRPRSEVKQPKIAPKAGYFVARHLFTEMGAWPSCVECAPTIAECRCHMWLPPCHPSRPSKSGRPSSPSPSPALPRLYSPLPCSVLMQQLLPWMPAARAPTTAVPLPLAFLCLSQQYLCFP